MSLLGFPLAVLIGLSLGLLGGGGSIITVPILVYVLGFEPKQAIAMGLAIVGATSLVGALGHWREGNLQPRAALVFGGMAMGGSFAGARLSVFLSGAAQLVLFSTVMLVAAVFMSRNTRRGALAGAPAPEPHRAAFPLIAASALGVGTLTGLVGVGGGFLIVPALVLRVGLPMKRAVGTSLLVISLNSFVGFAGHLGHVDVPWGGLSAFTALAIVGILGGTRLSRAVSQAALQRAFAGLLVVMGGLILYQNRHVLAPVHPSESHARPDLTRGGSERPRSSFRG
ncbi:sulfite exporter TauE/SafE family protein [Melittangium boletus]|uniref:Probable membrane transporter protein n=1 Tax=Melittangium boletus DSM 14713 TaxID=1294270 RepID=A0A250III2_9BACT|nr:sulfite exporter TauE/SafE family protein [Melittangium boletus]ATB31629.1 permease [Melittangium boletus DSM 14713]